MPVTDGYTYTIVGSDCTVTDYDPTTSSGGYTPSIPATLDGYNVTILDTYSFSAKSLTAVTLPNSVITIGNSAFYNNSIAALTITSSVTTIDSYAFLDNLITALTIPTTLTSIGESAFDNNLITSLSFTHNLYIGAYAFADNPLTSVSFSTNVTSGNFPFYNATLGSGVTLNSSITTISTGLLGLCGITSITLPSSLTTIESYGMYQYEGTSITLPNTLTTIGASAFYDCLLQSLDIPSSVTTIGDYAFTSSDLTSVTIDHDMSIGSGAFTYYSGLTSVSINANITFTGIDYEGIFEITNAGQNVTIGTSCTTLPNFIFQDCGMESVLFPSTVTAIGNYGMYNNPDLSSIYVLNPTMTFGTNVLDLCTPSPKGTIYGFAGSTAQTLATTYSTYYDFVAIGLDLNIHPGSLCKIYFDNNLYFTGLVDTTTLSGLCETKDQLNQGISCISLKSMLSRRTIKVNYDEGDSSSDIITDMIDTYLYQEGIEEGTISTGIDIGEMWLDDCISIYDVIDQMASKNGWQWYIDENFELSAYDEPVTTPDADYDLDGVSYSNFANLKVTSTINNYLNKMFVVGGNDDNGNQVFSIFGDLTEQNAQQLRCGLSGVYGEINRDAGNIETTIATAESGTTTTNITITTHGLAVDDFIWNLTREAYTLVTAIVDNNNVTVLSVTGQTTGDEIVYYPSANLIGKNIIRNQGRPQKTITFDCNYIDFIPGTRLYVNLLRYNLFNEYYNINSVSIQNVEKNYYKTSVSATLRNSDDFSTKKSPDGLTFFKEF